MQVLEPRLNHTHTVFNLHGRDSNAADYCNEFFESEDSSSQNLHTVFPTFKWIFPTAPQIPSKRFGTDLSQWFDMWSTDDPHERSAEQTARLGESAAAVAQLVRHEGSIIGMKNVILCGISQGAATAIAVLLQLDEPLCAFVGFASWMPVLGYPLSSKPSIMTPVFLAHCQGDLVIDIKYGTDLSKYLQKAGMQVEFHAYANGGHWINEPQGIDDVINFLRGISRIAD